MRWNARKATWAMSAALASTGLVSGEERFTLPSTTLIAPRSASPYTRVDTNTTNQFVEGAHRAASEADPKKLPSTNLEGLTLPLIPGLAPGTTEAGPVPRVVSGPAANVPGALTEKMAVNPWEDIPRSQVYPRAGTFLIPGKGPGFYSLLDQVSGNSREKPPALPYPAFALQPPSGFDADYRYLDKPDNTQVDVFDIAKRMHLTPDTMLTIGGQSSARYMNEVDSRLSRRENEYSLYRNRIWADVWYTDQFRVVGEFLSALSEGNDLDLLPIDKNPAAIQNLFVDANVGVYAGNPAYVRVGRQELLFGSQRLITTLDWANTRRTFEGVRGFWRSTSIDLDLFCVNPVLVDPNGHDDVDRDVKFFGAWATFRSTGQVADVYYLGLKDDNQTRDRFTPGPNAQRGTRDIHTLGGRYAGTEGPFLFDIEGMVQCGTAVGRDVKAHSYTLAAGYEWQKHAWRPQAWLGFDYASGTSDPTANVDRTFNQLFAFGHHFFGYLDLVGRQNVQDLYAQVAMFPENWITLLAQCHHFRLANSRDFLYNAAGRPTRRSATGIAGQDVGQEIDLLANVHLTPHQDVLIGYSKLFAGDFIKNTGPNVSPELFYMMYNFRW